MKDWNFDSRPPAAPADGTPQGGSSFRLGGSPFRSGGSPFRLVMGLAVICIGVLFFLHNLYWIDARPLLRFCPAVVVLGLGAASLYQSRRLTLAVGLWFLAGGWLLLDALRLTDLDFWQAVVPLGLVLLGVRLLTRSFDRREPATPSRVASPADAADAGGAAGGGDVGGAVGSSGESSLSAFALMASVRRASHSTALRRVDAVAVMAGVEIDLTHATPPAGGTVDIDASTIWGGIEIWVPTDWAIDFRPFALMGGAEDKTRQSRAGVASGAPVDGSRPRVIVRGFALMGAIEIKNRPSSSAAG